MEKNSRTGKLILNHERELRDARPWTTIPSGPTVLSTGPGWIQGWAILLRIAYRTSSLNVWAFSFLITFAR